MCKFSGLASFPFGTLACQIEFGGWHWSGGYQGINLREGPTPGYELSVQEATSGSSYQEYTIKSVSVSRTNYEYESAPSEPWPIIIYTITLQRASSFYFGIIII